MHKYTTFEILTISHQNEAHQKLRIHWVYKWDYILNKVNH